MGLDICILRYMCIYEQLDNWRISVMTMSHYAPNGSVVLCIYGLIVCTLAVRPMAVITSKLLCLPSVYYTQFHSYHAGLERSLFSSSSPFLSKDGTFNTPRTTPMWPMERETVKWEIRLSHIGVFSNLWLSGASHDGHRLNRDQSRSQDGSWIRRYRHRPTSGS